MRLRDAGEIRQDHDTFQLQPTQDGREYVFQARVEGAWATQYSFDLGHQEWVDFLPANWLNSTHPETLFVKHLVVMRQTLEGRVILMDDKLKTVKRGDTSVRQLAPEERAEVLSRVFGLAADD